MTEDTPQLYLRPKKRVALKNVENSLVDLTGKLSVEIFHNSTILPRGQIVNIQQCKNQHTIIDDIDYCCDILHCEFPVDESTVLYGGYFRHQWGHFLLNTTARLWWIFTNDTNLESVDKIVFISTPGESERIDANYKEFFELLGIYEKIEIISCQKNYRKIIVPDISFEHDRFYAKEMNGVFERIIRNSLKDNNAIPKKYNKIFLTRSQLPGGMHKEINLNFFDKLWEKNGFKVIAPEKISLKQLVIILNHAENVVSVSGSTAHNLLFASPETSITIMERTAAVNDFQVGIKKMTRQDVKYIDCFLYPIIPIPTGNVFYYYPTQLFRNFFYDNNLKFFDKKTLEKLCDEKNIFKFFSSYKKQSGHYLGLPDNPYELESVAEAYLETSNIYRDAMTCRCYFKLKLKKILVQLKRKFRRIQDQSRI